jgi:hypothetical protein
VIQRVLNSIPRDNLRVTPFQKSANRGLMASARGGRFVVQCGQIILHRLPRQISNWHIRPDVPQKPPQIGAIIDNRVPRAIGVFQFLKKLLAEQLQRQTDFGKLKKGFFHDGSGCKMQDAG